MGLIAYDGFDHYAGGLNGGDIISRTGDLVWSFNTTGNNFPITPSTNTRTGSGRSLSVGDGMYTTLNPTITASLAANLTTMFVGYATIMGTVGGHVFGGPSMRTIFVNNNASANHVYFTYNMSGGVIQCYRSSNTNATPDTLLATSAPNVINVNLWEFVEFGVTLDGTAGAIYCQVNGSPILSVTGINTLGTGAGTTMNAVAVQQFSGGGSASFYIDDFYVNDNTTGAGTYPCNGFMGDCRVVTLFPTTNSGSPTWTPTPGTNANWQNVSEVAFDAGSTYNATSTPGNIDLFASSTISGVISKAIAVRVTGAYAKTDASARTVSNEINSAGVVSTAAAHPMSTSYSYYSDNWVLDPNTGASWTINAINTLKFGYDLVT